MVMVKVISLHAKQTQRGCGGLSLSILDPGARRWWMVSFTTWPFQPQEKDPVYIVQEAGWASVLVWMCPENPTLTGIRVTDRPARSKPTRLPRPVDTYKKLFNRVPKEQP